MVGIKDPESDGYLGGVRVQDEAVITSGGYERYFTDDDGTIYWHIMDPSTGAPAHSGLISVTIIGPCGLRCDGLSTALFVMGRGKAAAHWAAHDLADAGLKRPIYSGGSGGDAGNSDIVILKQI